MSDYGKKISGMKRLNNEFPHTHQGCHKVLKYVALFLGVGGCKKLKINLNNRPEELARGNKINNKAL